MSETVSSKERIGAAEANLDRMLEWVGRYDNKSSALLGIDTAMVGVLALIIHGLGTSLLESYAIVLTLLFLGGAFLFLFLFIGAYPRLKAPADSLLFFGTISKKKADEYKKAFESQTEQEYLDDLLIQCHRNSEILDVKFRYLKLAFQLIVIAIIPWSLALVFS
jgi:hypothetical protein